MLTHARYKRLCEVIYRLEARQPKQCTRLGILFSKLRLSKALFDDHGSFSD